MSAQKCKRHRAGAAAVNLNPKGSLRNHPGVEIVHRSQHKDVFTQDAVNADIDRQWFEANPQRSSRIRLATPTEALLASDLRCGDGVVLATVYRLGPGLRLRGFISVSPRTAARLLREEGVA